VVYVRRGKVAAQLILRGVQIYIVYRAWVFPHTRPNSPVHTIEEGQPLGKDIGELGSHQDVEDTNIPNDNLNMLGTLMLDGVDGEIDGADVIVID
jgi:hypothetical protein